MYLSHFGLKELPFTITPDTGFFMNRAGYQDALNVLLVAVRSGEGFIKVTGEVGVGKTILCRKLLKTLSGEFVTAYIHNPYLKPESLLFAIADELGVKYEPATPQHQLLKLITRALLHYHAAGRNVVLCLDEVQAMPIETLETLRLLTNIETEKRKLLQVVLFGQPELDALLEKPSVRQLKQRITFSYRLLPLNRVALVAYIRHRLAVAGYKGRDLLTRQAYDYLYHATGGIPRLINIICHKAMLVAYGRGDQRITLRHVRAAVKDTQEAQRFRHSYAWFWVPRYSLALITMLGLITLLFMARNAIDFTAWLR
jgi:MSHA biogenesis protein MshM